MIYINEVLSNPVGKDSGNEWLELFNDAPRLVSIDGWHLIVNSKTTALHGVIPADGYRVIGSKELHRALTNREMKLGLYNTAGQREDAHIIYGTAHEGKSYSRFEDGSFHWSDPTPGAANSSVHAVPVAEQELPVGVNLVPHGSFTHALGSGMLMALILSLLVTSIFLKNHALPQFISRSHTPLRR